MQDRSNSSALAMELLQSCTESPIYSGPSTLPKVFPTSQHLFLILWSSWFTISIMGKTWILFSPLHPCKKFCVAIAQWHLSQCSLLYCDVSFLKLMYERHDRLQFQFKPEAIRLHLEFAIVLKFDWWIVPAKFQNDKTILTSILAASSVREILLWNVLLFI